MVSNVIIIHMACRVYVHHCNIDTLEYCMFKHRKIANYSEIFFLLWGIFFHRCFCITHSLAFNNASLGGIANVYIISGSENNLACSASSVLYHNMFLYPTQFVHRRSGLCLACIVAFIQTKVQSKSHSGIWKSVNIGCYMPHDLIIVSWRV